MKPFSVWIGGEFFGTIWARHKTGVTWVIATIIHPDVAVLGAKCLLVKPR